MALTAQQSNLIARFNKLRLSGFADMLMNQFNNSAAYIEATYEDKLEDCLSAHEQYLGSARFLRLKKAAGLTDSITLNEISQKLPLGLDREQIRYLIRNTWIENAVENIIISGSCGVGKSCLANAIAIHACKSGYRTLFYKATELLEELAHKDNGDRIKYRNKLLKTSVLILDDFGIKRLSEEAIYELYLMLDSRYNKYPVIVTTQLKPEVLLSYLGKVSTRSEAVIERLCKPAVFINLIGDSKRPERRFTSDTSNDRK